MHTLPDDPNVFDYVDLCLPLLGTHLILCLPYIPMILSFNHRFRQHRRTKPYPSDLGSRKPIELFLLCVWIALQFCNISRAMEGATNHRSFFNNFATFLHPIAVCITLCAVVYCLAEERTFAYHILEPYKQILPSLPTWEKIRSEKKRDTMTSSTPQPVSHNIFSSLYWPTIQSQAVLFWHYLVPFAYHSLPQQTPICIFTRYQIRAFSYAQWSALAMILAAFSTCDEGLQRWLIGGFGGQSGWFEIRTKLFYGWIGATLTFLVQAARVFKQSEVVAAREGIDGYEKERIAQGLD